MCGHVVVPHGIAHATHRSEVTRSGRVTVRECCERYLQAAAVVAVTRNGCDCVMVEIRLL